MSGLGLKNYQRDALTALTNWLTETSKSGDPDMAFYKATKRAYRPVPGLEGIPYACLRVPTGGGKTLIAAHAIGRATDALVTTENPCAIWLAPSDAIVSQTLTALRDVSHPYRAALAERFGSNVRVMDVKEALYARRPDYDGNAAIIVATIQSFRQEETDTLNVYKDNGELMDHFSGLEAGALVRLEKSSEGQMVRSLANALKLRRPMVIVDEAHNARTDLSFTTLARLDPSLIVELTATPADDSNILFHVSAAALRDEAMIKLPVILRVDPDPVEALRLAKAKLEELHEAAAAETEALEPKRRLRPVMLIQAQQNTGADPLTPERVRALLEEDFQVPREQIKIATGKIWELAGIDLSMWDEPTRFIVTVQKLREGWDCPNAYVLCTLAPGHSGTAVEQMLGRVLRLPGAVFKADDRLNQAYAFASATSFAETAKALAEALVSNGFEKLEAEKLIRADALVLPLEPDELTSEAIDTDIDLAPYRHVVAAATAGRVTLDPEIRQLSASDVTAADAARLRLLLPPLLVPALDSLLARHEERKRAEEAGVRSATRPERPLFAVPQLCVRRGEQLEIFGADHFLDRPWSLEQCDASTIVERFAPPSDSATEAVIDLASEQVRISFVERMQRELELTADQRDWPYPKLVRWIDQRLAFVKGSDVTQGSAQAFIKAGLQALMDDKGYTISDLRRLRFRLIEPFTQLIRDYRDIRQKDAFESTLFGEVRFDWSEDLTVMFDPERYYPPKLYTGRVAFPKHLRPDLIGDMNGEEEACANEIDRHVSVLQWVRNIERQKNAFRLRVSSQDFYPDFVAQLIDSTYFIVEYKGAGTEGPRDRTDEKEAIGKKWAEVTGNRFVMVKDRDYSAVRQALEAG
ncbi:MAG TPA: DEAD/DEAH box helicase family protein [Allosphingosinicella sp.]|nr:DEAD/DEAH box helicase family protein [Allosphingosinicella sp.]